MAPIGTVTAIARAVATREQTAEAVVRQFLDRIEALDGRLHAFLHYDRERSVARAREIDGALARNEKLGPLGGVPIAIKDNLCTSASPTTCASKILEGFCAGYDAHVVERLEAAGAIVIGKTNLDEFAMGSSTEHGARGATRNPWDVHRVAGGSSGGSAAAVAAGLAPASLGSDTGGSIRQPASLCGVVGVKPSYGRVSRYGLVAFGSSLDQVGPLARDVRDAALLLGVIAGFDERDSTSVDQPVPDYVAALDQPLDGVRIGLIDAEADESLDPEVASAVTGAVERLERAGARLIPIELPHRKYAVACYYIIAPAEASSNLARFDGGHYGRRSAEPGDIMNLYAASRGEGFGSEVKRRIMLGTYALSSGYYEAYYLKALKVRTLIMRDFDRAFDRVDVIASPAAPTPAFPLGEKTDDPLAMYLSDIYTLAASLAGICAVSIPCGFSSGGLPIGLQLMGPSFGEERLLSVAHQYQQLTEHHTQWPSPATAT